MKKSLVALAVLSAAAVAQAAPQQNTFYAGAKAGWATLHEGVRQFNQKYENDARYQNGTTDAGINRNSVTYGVFGGYQILNQNNFGLAAELGYDFYGRARGNQDEGKHTTYRHSAHGLNLALKPSYEVLPNLDVYGKVGVAVVRNDYKFSAVNTGKDKAEKYHKLKASTILGAGVEYAITPELAARVEYQYLNKAGNLNKAIERTGNGAKNLVDQYAPDIHSVSAGLSYRFGQGAAPVEAAPEVVTKNFAFSSDVLFAFGKSNLKPAAAAALDAANTEIANLGLASPAIQVNGYTDRIGKEASNLKLSQRRAETVANYLVSKGQNAANVTAVGYGEANPVTGATCDAVKGRKALIACLAPDRRVEVQVQGSKNVTM
ncbi:porin OmpA [Actinobacillus equuli]|uniref:porin OmpA n=1 Tax=Actinobacillus equuli TaxID=718 RepID=UPI002441F3B7|nr:porin OmpA [Actinobacillus equuli]WGE56938.1 porin OmpA [Actinobacillus equuli subsp. equuli]WGE56939.1 porin OmpA [Actinobacillus equuli subsp. equuli]